MAHSVRPMTDREACVGADARRGDPTRARKTTSRRWATSTSSTSTATRAAFLERLLAFVRYRLETPAVP
jgi:hypothetical protein